MIKPISKAVAIAAAKKLHAEIVYNISTLEGVNYTYAEVETLLSGITVGGHKVSDEQLILNQSESWKLLIKLIENDEFDLSKEMFCRLHAVVAREEALSWGEFRTSGVSISGVEYQPPKAELLDGIFSTLLDTLEGISDPVEKAMTFFLQSSRAQFFFDGNKRTSRLMANGILLSAGFFALNIKAKQQLEFNELLREFYETGHQKPIEAFLVQTVSDDMEKWR